MAEIIETYSISSKCRYEFEICERTQGVFVYVHRHGALSDVYCGEACLGKFSSISEAIESVGNFNEAHHRYEIY